MVRIYESLEIFSHGLLMFSRADGQHLFLVTWNTTKSCFERKNVSFVFTVTHQVFVNFRVVAKRELRAGPKAITVEGVRSGWPRCHSELDGIWSGRVHKIRTETG